MARLTRFGHYWNVLGRDNAYGAIITGSAGSLADWQTEQFLATGRLDAERFIADLGRLAPDVARRRGLDFGCGVGRVTRALADHFTSVTGVDVAASMIAQARRLNHDRSNCRFVVNAPANLRQFDDGEFDVVYSRLVLQHIPQKLVRAYIPELVRILSRGGALMFQLPGFIRPEPEEDFVEAPVVGHVIKRSLPRAIVRAYRRLKYRRLAKEWVPRMLMFGLARDEVVSLVERSGGRIVSIQADQSHGPDVPGFEYWVTK